MGPRLLARGVDMFRNTWCASVETELSNALAAWTHDSMEPVLDTTAGMPEFSVNHRCIPQCVCESPHERPEQRAPGLILFCRCPQGSTLFENKSTERTVAGGRIYLMSYPSEF